MIPSTSAPAKTTEPRSGRRNPESRLNSVVLPAPFGPMRALMAPCGTSKDTLSTALRPPNRLLMLRIERSFTFPSPRRRGKPLPCAPRTAAADRNERDVPDGFHDRGLRGPDAAVVMGEQHAGESRKGGGKHEGGKLVPGGGDPHRLGGVLGAVDRGEGPPGRSGKG